MTAIAYGRIGDRSLAEVLREEPWQFDFYQAVRLLEAIRRKIDPAEPAEENTQTIRFESRVSFSFPASEVQAITDGSDPPRMTVNFLGLAGGLGPLPATYTEMILAAAARKDHAAADFLDIFNNRLVWLLYRARQAHHPSLTARAPQDGRIARYLFSLIGLGQPSLRNRLAVPDRSLLHYSGLLAPRVRSAAGLERMLADYFDVTVNVSQFRGVWRNIDPNQQTTLGVRGSNHSLGNGTVLGRRVWDQGGGLTVTLGPLDWERYSAFLPRRDASRALCELTRFYVGREYDVQVRLLLEPASVPPSTLGRARLGYSSWLIGRSYRFGAAEARFSAWFTTAN